MYDVLIVGAGPAGAVAATVAARAGLRVGLIDRATFPRPKLCGDTLNPGVLAMFRRLALTTVAEVCGLRVDGMILTGENGTRIEGRYPNGLHGRAITRADLDWGLVRGAVAAGAEFMDSTTVLAPIVEGAGDAPRVGGVVAQSNGEKRLIQAPVTIGADGRHSTLGFALGLTRHPARPRRWAIGVYAERVTGMSAFGEMHIRRDHYIGVAPLPNGVANVCLVKPSAGGDPDLRDPLAALRAALSGDAVLRDRFARARFLAAPTVIGPVAVDLVDTRPVPDGLLLAGDAAGFVDPMTGDGLRFAVRGGELAAGAAIRAVEHGWAGVQARLSAARRREFASKWRFNRTLRAMVGSPLAVRTATAGAPYLGPILRSIIRRASDCDLARQDYTTTVDTEDAQDEVGQRR